MVNVDTADFLKKMGLTGASLRRHVTVVRQSDALVTVNFINLDPARVAERRGGGAEAHNNQQLFFVHDAGGGRVRLSHAINGLKRSAPSLRGRTGEPDAVAAYLGAYVSRTAEAVAPSLTHERPS